MARQSYAELLKDPRWQRKRLEILQRDGWRCQKCEREDKTLHVHHRRYVYGRKPWEYEEQDLVTLCEDCHEKHSRLDVVLKEMLPRLDSHDFAETVGFVIGVRIRELDANYGDENGEYGFIDGVDAEVAEGIARAFGAKAESVVALVSNDGNLRLDLERAANVLLFPRGQR